MKEYVLTEKMLNIARDEAKGYLRKLKNRVESLLGSDNLTEKEFKRAQAFEELEKILRDYFIAAEYHIETLDSEVKRLEIENVKLKEKVKFNWELFEEENKSHIETIEIWRSKIS